jgi:hypothetical protein
VADGDHAIPGSAQVLVKDAGRIKRQMAAAGLNISSRPRAGSCAKDERARRRRRARTSIAIARVAQRAEHEKAPGREPGG